MDYKEEQNGEIEALLSIYEGEIEGKEQDKNMPVGNWVTCVFWIHTY